ncbi:hypothetical protein [Bacteroides graminisolvens]|uniref:hypothetical protein n=1 Tax=Bacteroides graminisolvens TaxID=477666 RepID=UPI0023F23D68|nr:hypothetical protein [Bacteroides graminisolvens]
MKIKLSLGLFAVGLLAFNLSFYENNIGVDPKLENIKLMQANAGEYNCDKSNLNICETFARKSTGVLTYYD